MSCGLIFVILIFAGILPVCGQRHYNPESFSSGEGFAEWDSLKDLYLLTRLPPDMHGEAYRFMVIDSVGPATKATTSVFGMVTGSDVSDKKDIHVYAATELKPGVFKKGREIAVQVVQNQITLLDLPAGIDLRFLFCYRHQPVAYHFIHLLTDP